MLSGPGIPTLDHLEKARLQISLPLLPLHPILIPIPSPCWRIQEVRPSNSSPFASCHREDVPLASRGCKQISGVCQASEHRSPASRCHVLHPGMSAPQPFLDMLSGACLTPGHVYVWTLPGFATFLSSHVIINTKTRPHLGCAHRAFMGVIETHGGLVLSNMS